MIKLIFIKEIKDKILSPYYIYFNIFIVCIITLYAIFNYIDYYNKHNRYLHESQEKTWLVDGQEAHIKNGEIKLIDLVFGKQKIIKPPSKLSFIAKNYPGIPNGIDINYFSISNFKQYSDQFGYLCDSNRIDWSYIIILFISVVCIGLSYDAFSGEKENGTLKLMLSCNVSRIKLLLGKYLSILFLVMMPIIIGLLLNVLIVNIGAFYVISLHEILLIILYGFGTMLFLSIIILIGLFISSLTSKPGVSLSISITIWILLYLIIPNIAWIYGKTLISVPTYKEVKSQEQFDFQHVPWKSKWENSSPSDGVYRRKDAYDKATVEDNNLWNNYRNLILRQTEKSIQISNISPFTVFRFMGDKIANNGYYGYISFYSDIQDYYNAYKKQITEIEMDDKKSHHLIWNDPRKKTKHFMSKNSVDVKEVIQYKYSYPKVSSIVNNIKLNIIYLISWSLLLCIGTVMALNKYDVR